MSLLCPIDFRYGRPAMKDLFTEAARLQRLLDVEAALARAHAKVGNIPAEAAREIAAKATTRVVSVDRIVVGKMSGAVGTGAALGPKAGEIERAVMEDLGVGVEEAATQIVGRDRYAEFVTVLANLGTSLDKFCTEVRNLQRTEIAEVAEAFDAKGQVGSSTMAQKENPVSSENVCSLARIVRCFVIPAYEDGPLWHGGHLA